MKKLDLGNEKISKLLKAFSIPCIISLVVNALYNMVDQIFIGWGVGYLGNGATNVVFPITVICLAFALMFGDGTSAYLSLKLGEKKKEEAEKGVWSGIFSSIIISILFCIFVLIFLPTLINLFGSTEKLQNYALDYGYVIAFGIPFMMIGTTFNSIIRADGSPKYAMASMVIGAILNIILDPIAIFVLDMGVKGAALATIISQFVTFIMNITYLFKFKSIEMNKKTVTFSVDSAKRVSLLGISSFITQMSIVIIIAVQNNLLSKYGATSKFGSEIPITVLGIVMKINQILSSIVIGIAAGSQPIVGFNYGARNYDRVKQTLKIVLTLSLSISVIAFLLFQTIPEQLIGLFGSGDALYNEFACLTFRIFLMLTIFNGIQIASGIFFQAIGKSGKAALLSLSRQILIFIPAAFILTKLFGVMGVLYAGPVSDGLAFIISGTLLFFEVRKLNGKKEETRKEQIIGMGKQGPIITINREYGSGGRYVGELLASKLKVHLYDKNLIEIVSSESGLSATYIENQEQNRAGNLLSELNRSYFQNISNDDALFLAESNAIKEISKKGSCVIVGRCADYILKEEKNVFRIFLYSDLENKINRVTKYYGISKNPAKEIEKVNKARERHYEHYTDMKWKDASHYELCLNVDLLGVEKTADLIVKVLKEKKK
ncbi:MAG: MATE family efflux transporter [Bacilli bacterium]|nr:MATE family efflux transporter [Bacilli bacterium]